MKRFLILVILYGLFSLAGVSGIVAQSLFSKAESTGASESVKYLALGDSYTIGQGVMFNEKFPIQLANRLEAGGINMDTTILLGQTGWRTDVLLSAIGNANLTDTFDLVSLLIGVNNQAQGYPAADYKIEFSALLDSAIALAGGRKDRVFVLSIPDYGYTPFGQANQPTISAELEVFNDINKNATAAVGISWFNITPISQTGLIDPTLVAPDGLHPSGIMYAKWVELIFKDIRSSISGLLSYPK